MRAIEVNRKGWTARCGNITGWASEEEVGVWTPLHGLTKDVDFLTRSGPSLEPGAQRRAFRSMGGPKWKGRKHSSRSQVFGSK